MIDWNNLDDAQRDQITVSSLDLMRTLTVTMGTDCGMKTWERITEVLGDDAKAAIFFSMLTGSSGATIRVSAYPSDQKVSFIKIVRNYTGMGLKEAKDLSDLIGNPYPKTYIEFKVKSSGYQSCRSELRAIGATLQ